MSVNYAVEFIRRPSVMKAGSDQWNIATLLSRWRLELRITIT